MTRRLGGALLCAAVVGLLPGCGVDAQGGGDAESEGTGREARRSALDGPHDGPRAGFEGGFAPRRAPYGGFGGGACRAARTPIVYLPGNGDTAENLDFAPAAGGPSVYEVLRSGGYQPCELFGVDYLSPGQRLAPLYNFHGPEKADLVAGFVRDVLAYTGAERVDVIGHSLGVTVGLHALSRGGLWPRVRRFVAISGAMRGLASCVGAGAANAAVPVCGSQNVYAPDVFGFYPDALAAPNPRMGARGFRRLPARAPGVRFYAIGAGFHDGFLCSTTAFTPDCFVTALFEPSENVVAQMNVGFGSTALELDYRLDDFSVFRAGAGDVDGVGHFRAKTNTGLVQLNMLTTDCRGADCCVGYAGPCR